MFLMGIKQNVGPVKSRVCVKTTTKTLLLLARRHFQRKKFHPVLLFLLVLIPQ